MKNCWLNKATFFDGNVIESSFYFVNEEEPVYLSEVTFRKRSDGSLFNIDKHHGHCHEMRLFEGTFEQCVIEGLRRMCYEENVPFEEDWVHIGKDFACVQDEFGRVFMRMNLPAQWESYLV